MVPNVVRGKWRGTLKATFSFNRTGPVGGWVRFSFMGEPVAPSESLEMLSSTETPRSLATTIQPQQGLAPLK